RQVAPPVRPAGRRDPGGVADLEHNVFAVLERACTTPGLAVLRRVREDQDGGAVLAVREVEEDGLRLARLRAVLFADAFRRGVPAVDDNEVILPERELLPGARIGERWGMLAAQDVERLERLGAPGAQAAADLRFRIVAIEEQHALAGAGELDDVRMSE